jgi:lysophospholipase L1-like esterase
VTPGVAREDAMHPTRFATLALLILLAPAAAADDSKVRVVMVGDSTMSSYPKPPADRPDLTGWGQVFGEVFTDKVEVLNHAASGRSTKSFVNEGRWKKALDAKPDWVFIQFGHNDQKDKTLDPTGGYSEYLRRYIDDARKVGAKPVLVAPVARRTFADGKPTTSLTPYADAARAVAKEKGVPVIDLHALSLAVFAKLGDDGSADFSASKTDRTHWSRKGAKEVAGLVAKAIPDAVPELKVLLKP